MTSAAVLPFRNVPDVALQRCNYCSKRRRRFELRRLAGHAQLICDDCIDWHNRAVEFLAGSVPPGCQECRATWEFLRDSTPFVEIRMYVVPKDGIYQLLCAACVRPYLPKRQDLYRGTQFGTDVLKLP
ncbi:MAG TPA: hypothetical protein VG273_16485 [Bryobacteraceae bacterium]|jgi:hypothetical protein|nr:hypothetical protein [Bryobacteraceae bacterium]